MRYDEDIFVLNMFVYGCVSIVMASQSGTFVHVSSQVLVLRCDARERYSRWPISSS